MKMDIERRGAQDLATAISLAESLVEYKKGDRAKGPVKPSNGKSAAEAAPKSKEGPRGNGSKEKAQRRGILRDGGNLRGHQ